MPTRPLRRAFLFVAVLVLLAGSGISSATPDHIRHYKAGLNALDQHAWQQAESSMLLAISHRSKEKRRPAWRPRTGYFPHFYLGLARYQGGDCQGAIDAWNESETQASIVGRPQYDHLRRWRDDCRQNGRRSQTVDLETLGLVTSGKERTRSIQSWVERGAEPADRLLGTLEQVAPEGSDLHDIASQGRGVLQVAEEATNMVDLVMAPPEQLSAAIDAYFSGRPSHTLALLDTVETDDPRAMSQVLLFRAAANHRLYLETSDPSYLKTAREHAEQFQQQRWNQDLPVDLFDPRFVRFVRGGG